jgi:hypothetical protein
MFFKTRGRLEMTEKSPLVLKNIVNHLLFHHFKSIYQFPKHIIFLVKIVANASLRKYLVTQLTFSHKEYEVGCMEVWLIQFTLLKISHKYLRKIKFD